MNIGRGTRFYSVYRGDILPGDSLICRPDSITDECAPNLGRPEILAMLRDSTTVVAIASRVSCLVLMSLIRIWRSVCTPTRDDISDSSQKQHQQPPPEHGNQRPAARLDLCHSGQTQFTTRLAGGLGTREAPICANTGQ